MYFDEDRPRTIVIRKVIEKTLILGLDLGQAKDYSALAALRRTVEATITDVEGASATRNNTKDKVVQLDCIGLKRWDLRTSYPAIVADVVQMIANLDPELTISKPILAVDATGVGAPVVDLFKKERLNAMLVPIQITGGANVTEENGMVRVPKRELVSVVQVGLQTKLLKIAQEMPLADTLSRELQNFQVKITDSANDVYGAWREGAHDDLVLGLAMAVWKAMQPVYRQPVIYESISYQTYW